MNRKLVTPIAVFVCLFTNKTENMFTADDRLRWINSEMGFAAWRCITMNNVAEFLNDLWWSFIIIVDVHINVHPIPQTACSSLARGQNTEISSKAAIASSHHHTPVSQCMSSCNFYLAEMVRGTAWHMCDQITATTTKYSGIRATNTTINAERRHLKKWIYVIIIVVHFWLSDICDRDVCGGLSPSTTMTTILTISILCMHIIWARVLCGRQKW